MKNSLLLGGMVLLLTTTSIPSSAQPGFIASRVTRIVNEEGFWGGCAARLVPDPATIAGLESCAPNYVSFDCDGSSGQASRSTGATKLANAQLAFVAGFRFFVKVDPNVKLNGVCFATRADVLEPL